MLYVSLILLVSPFSFELFGAEGTSDEKFICSAIYARGVIKKVDIPRAGDKFKHCAVSCMLTLRCGGTDAFTLGLIKEVLDLMGFGEAEWEDIDANLVGIEFAEDDIALSDDDCIRECRVDFPF